MNPHKPPLIAPQPSDATALGALQLMERLTQETSIPGMSVAVAGPTQVHFTGAVGYADLATRRRTTTAEQYPWFSMTKIATATAAMRLHADGQLELDAPIGTYLPSYRPHRAYGHPTMRHLLSHTAGLGNPVPVRWVRAQHQPVDAARQQRILEKHGTPHRPVGARAAYSNIGYLLAAEAIHAVTGQRVEDCIRGRVLSPLGMTSTGFRFNPDAPRSVGYLRLPRVLRPVLHSVMPPGIVGPQSGRYTSFHPFLVDGAGYGGLIGTAVDAARLAAAHAASAGDPHPVLRHRDIEAMRTITSPGKPFDHGVGWFRKPTDADRDPAFVEHYGTGGGFWSAMRVYPESRLAMVAMTNTTSAWDVDRFFTELKDLSWT